LFVERELPGEIPENTWWSQIDAWSSATLFREFCILFDRGAAWRISTLLGWQGGGNPGPDKNIRVLTFFLVFHSKHNTSGDYRSNHQIDGGTADCFHAQNYFAELAMHWHLTSIIQHAKRGNQNRVDESDTPEQPRICECHALAYKPILEAQI
jgi:hypothetical protein